jgi:CO/xanthine dehydrogenase Mo-binding subunit
MTGGTIIGRSQSRSGGVERVTGTQRYAADIHLDKVLHVKLVTLPCARAAIRHVDRSRALSLAGVRAILSAEDLPDPMPRYGPVFADRPLLATGETKFFGEPAAVVAADTIDAAIAAAALVEVLYDELPPVLTAEAALDPRSPLVQDPSLRRPGPHAQSNVLEDWTFGWGSVDGVEAECVIEHDYSFPMVTHFAIEPHAFMAAPSDQGITIWSPVQHPFVLQRVVAGALAWPLSRVRIIAPDPGGAFGGKGWPKFEPLLAYLALHTQRPVRLVLTLEESFQAARRTSAQVHARTGFDRSGKLLFQDIDANFLIGAYADIGARVVSKASYAACGPYVTPSARIRARALLSHTTPSTAFRGFGTPQASWAVESQLDEAARRLGIDRVEIRRRNLPQKHETFIPNDTPADGDWHEALTRAAAAIGWGDPLPSGRGRGISLGLKSSSTASASFAIVRIHFDGSVTVLSATSDMGQGARTVLAQIAAEALGAPIDRVAIIMGDTAVVPFDSSTSASRSTVFMGNAVLKACASLRDQLIGIAARMYNVLPGEVAYHSGTLRLPDQIVSYVEVLQAHFGPPRGELIGVGEERNAFDPSHPLGGSPSFWEMMCAAAEVSVDVETGMVRIERLVLVNDIGKALNPAQVEAQDEGAAMMGIGHTLMEHLLLDGRGRIRNLGALDYRIPTFEDIPVRLESILIENGDGPGPFGAKGAGEGGILAIAAAIGSAVAQATGVTVRDLPLTPERIWLAMRERNDPEK